MPRGGIRAHENEASASHVRLGIGIAIGIDFGFFMAAFDTVADTDGDSGGSVPPFSE